MCGPEVHSGRMPAGKLRAGMPGPYGAANKKAAHAKRCAA